MLGESDARSQYAKGHMSIAGIVIEAAPFDSEEAQRLIAALDEGLARLYTPDQRFGPNFKAAQIADGRAVYLIARHEGRAVACGAIQLLDPTTAEVKRMYTDDDMRGKGIGRAVLDELESRARAMGVTKLVLETGIHQHAAIALYTRAGFEQVDCWGEYLTSATSVCYAKELD